jgi:SAM-dependent methyltransferase
MNIPWKLKSHIFKFIEFLNSPSLLYFLQKNITKRSRIDKLTIHPAWIEHEKVLKKYAATEYIFEFGAGKNLMQNLFLSNFVEKQLIVDLNPMIDIDLVETSRYFLSKKFLLKTNLKIHDLNDLEKYGIQYKAPYDAANTDLKNKSLDACISTNTLEHIPYKDIVNIFTELRRTLKDKGVVSLSIDYSDHYAHTDKKISLLNFLKYDDKTWGKFNHKHHYQNRLRHNDYIKIFKLTGFELVDEVCEYKEKDIPKEIKNIYKNHKDQTWQATSANIILKKNLKFLI